MRERKTEESESSYTDTTTVDTVHPARMWIGQQTLGGMVAMREGTDRFTITLSPRYGSDSFLSFSFPVDRPARVRCCSSFALASSSGRASQLDRPLGSLGRASAQKKKKKASFPTLSQLGVQSRESGLGSGVWQFGSRKFFFPS